MAAHKRDKAVPNESAAPVREQLVRDSFTLPDSDYRLIGALKRRLLDSGIEAKKSEVVRAGLRMLASLDDAALREAFERIERIKTGRPAKGN
ncbi:MAG: hypothetical protein KF778_07380 [Rhodocyclaceae bacterium]|nr:hypothetical protein [Rhodocyclaceae bacterium]MBX3668212.1 hypothetical protein [Rhodocyclaceae bacterium]